ncbi:hypothetical protein C8F01DRAFT_962088, partial [Mycena amicta]
EIWLDIVQRLPSDQLADVSLLNRVFSHLVQPLLFSSTFELHPYALDAEDRASLLPDPPTMHRAQEQLEYWASDRIAHRVKTCSI